MRYQKALHGILFSIIVTASVFVGLSVISQTGVDQRASSNPYPETMPTASDAASVPTWDAINHTKLVIDTQEAPLPSATGVAGVIVPAATIKRSFVKATNVTNTQSQMDITYSDTYTINCTDSAAISNFTVNLNTPLIYPQYKKGIFIENWQTIRIRSYTNLSRSYTNLYPLIWPNVTEFDNRTLPMHFNFNISQAVQVFESTDLYTGAAFLFEVNFTVSLNCSLWMMSTKTGENFRIEGNQSTRLSNYTLTYRIRGPRGVNITFYYIPTDRNYTSNFLFYTNNTLLSPQPTYIPNMKGWRITESGGGLVKLDSTGIPFKVEFRGNATVGFIEQNAGRWNSDGMASRLDTRTRKFKLDVLAGPSTLLIERVEFTANDIPFSTVIQLTRSVTPTSSIAMSDDTYKFYDPVLEEEITKSNGTKLVIGRMQKANGSVMVMFSYRASYNATLRVLDELRNPLPGAEVTLYFDGVRFGTLMSTDESTLQPSKISNALGVVTFNFLPEGNYSVVVHFQNWIKTQTFSLYSGAESLFIDVVTEVPYQPWILVTWVVVFGMLCALGIALFKKKR